MTLTLKDKTFPIQTATLSAAICEDYRESDPASEGKYNLFWKLDVRTEGEQSGEYWEPQARHSSLRIPVRRWVDLTGKSVAWMEAFDDETGEPNGQFFIYEIGDMRRGCLEFVERDGARFRFEWEGVCDVLLNEDYDTDVPFSATGWADFTEVTVEGRESETAEILRKRLGEWLYPGDFIEGAFTQEVCPCRGVDMVQMIFTPSGIPPKEETLDDPPF